MIETVLMCVMPYLFTVESIKEYHICINNAEKIEHVADWLPTVNKYFEVEDIAQAMLIIYCESSGRSNAVGRNTNGTTDIGLWQWNDTTFTWLKNKLTNMKGSWNRFDPVFSTRLASWLVYNDGWHHWNSSKSCWGNRY